MVDRIANTIVFYWNRLKFHVGPTRVGWKVYRLSKKDLCHCNDTLHALNSPFPFSFQINPHWINNNSGLRKVVLETFRRRPGKPTKGDLFHQDNAPPHKSVVAMAAAVALHWFITLHILLTWHHLTIFCSPTWKTPHLAGKQYSRPMMRSYLQLRTFSRIRMRACILVPAPAPGGGGGHLHRTVTGTCRWGGGGGKTWPCLKPLGAQKIHPVTIYLTKNFHMHTLWEGERGGEEFAIERWFKVRWYWYGRTLYSPVYHHTFIKICCVLHAPLLVPRSWAWHKHCGLGTQLGSNHVINGVARH